MFVALNRSMRRHRGRLVAAALIVTFSAAVATTHVATAADHMAAAAVVCLAVLEVAVVARLHFGGAAPVRGARAAYVLPTSDRPIVATSFLPGRARAGPAALQVFRL